MRDGARAAAMLVLGALVAGLVLSPPVIAEPGSATKSFVRSLVKRRIADVRADLLGRIRTAGNGAFSTALPGPTPVTGAATDVTIRTLRVPAGTYVVVAKLWWETIPGGPSGSGGEIDCDLVAGSSSDTSREAGNSDFDFGTLPLLLTHSFQAEGTITLRCRDEFSAGDPVQVNNVRVTALGVGSLTVTNSASAGSAPQAPEPTR